MAMSETERAKLASEIMLQAARLANCLLTTVGDVDERTVQHLETTARLLALTVDSILATHSTTVNGSVTLLDGKLISPLAM